MSRKVIWLLYLLLAINVSYVLSGVLNFPIRSVDVLGFWLFRAKAFFIDGGMPLQTLQFAHFHSHPQYPILLPFVYSLIYGVMGQVWELPVLLLYPIYYCVILWLAFTVFKGLGLTKLQSITYVYFYSMMSPLLAQAGRGHAGSADIVVVLFSWLVILVWQREKKWGSGPTLAALTLLVAVASQIKSEGLFLIVGIVPLRVKFWRKILAALVCCLPTLLWMYLLQRYSIEPDFSFALHSFSELTYRVWVIAWVTANEMLNVRNWYFFWPLFWIALAISKARDNSFTQWLKILSLLMFCAFSAVYLTVTTDMYAHITSSIDRVLFQMTPFVFPVFVVLSQDILRRVSDSLEQRK